MPTEQKPLLTIAVPTYNRSRYLAELLEILAPQLAGESDVELIISDNASIDDTESVVESFCRQGMKCRYLRNEVNIGSDCNFLRCFREAAGEYFWLFGDDDILVPGGLRKILSFLRRKSWDLVFIRPYAFRNSFDEKDVQDPFGRAAMSVRDPVRFARLVGPMLTFISALIVNKAKTSTFAFPDPANLVDSGLIQLGWELPLLLNYKEGLVIFGGLVAGRMANSGGYALSKVLGQNLNCVTTQLLASRPDIAAGMLNTTLREWFPGTIVAARRGTAGRFEVEDYHRYLGPAFGVNPRYWIFVYPAIKLPLILAEPLVRIQAGFLFRVQRVLADIAALLLLRNDHIREA